MVQSYILNTLVGNSTTALKNNQKLNSADSAQLHSEQHLTNNTERDSAVSYKKKKKKKKNRFKHRHNDGLSDKYTSKKQNRHIWYRLCT